MLGGSDLFSLLIRGLLGGLVLVKPGVSYVRTMGCHDNDGKTSNQMIVRIDEGWKI